MTQFQNYLHFKLPITINPLEYGKLIKRIDNNFVIYLTTKNIVIIKQLEKENYVKLFRQGELIFEYKDKKLSDNSFSRYILDMRFTFTDNILVETSKMSSLGPITIFPISEDIFIKYEDTNSLLTTPILLSSLFLF